MFYQYYTLQKVILKTEDIQDDREEEEVKAVEKINKDDANSNEYEEEEDGDLKKNHNPYADFLNTIGDGEEVICDWKMESSFSFCFFIGRRGSRLWTDGRPQVLAGVRRFHDRHR